MQQNIKKAEYQVDRHIEKAENLKFINKNYDLTDYKYDKKFELLEKELKDILKLAIRLLHDDYLGGHGSRGYGQVEIKFDNPEGREEIY